MSATFELFNDGPGAFWFRLRASTGEILASSNTYSSKSAAEIAIGHVRTAAPTALLDDQT